MPDYPCGANRLPDEPTGHLQWHAWAERMLKTHEPKRCRVCKLWHLWVPRQTLTWRQRAKQKVQR